MADGNKDQPPKDRRMLVLFLFGVFLLVHDFVPFYHFFGTNCPVGKIDNSAVMFKDPTRKAGQGDGKKERLSPQLSYFLNKPMAINRASYQDLILLPGIGERLAKLILAYRYQYGPIHTLVELEKIRGISSHLARKISWMISFESTCGTTSIHAAD